MGISIIGPRQRPTVGSLGGAVSCKRGIPVGLLQGPWGCSRARAGTHSAHSVGLPPGSSCGKCTDNNVTKQPPSPSPPLDNPSSSQQRLTQGYLAHKKTHPHRTLQQAHAQGPMVVLRERSFRMSEVPLHTRESMGSKGQNGSNSHPKAGLSWPSLPIESLAHPWGPFPRGGPIEDHTRPPAQGGPPSFSRPPPSLALLPPLPPPASLYRPPSLPLFLSPTTRTGSVTGITRS